MVILDSHFRYQAGMRPCKTFIWVGLLLFLPLSATAQSDKRKTLEMQKVRLQDELQLASKILDDTRKNKELTLSEIQTFQKKIDLRQSLLRNIRREIELLDEEIQDLKEKIDTLQQEVVEKKAQYAEMIRQARQSKSSTSRLMFLLSSKDFNQAIKRVEYLKQYAEYRRRQVALIKEKEKDIENNLAELERQKLRKLALSREMAAEQANLIAEKKEQEEKIDAFRTQEKELAAEIEAKEKRSSKLEKQIQELIALEIKRAREAAQRREIEERAMALGLVRGKDFSSNTSNKRLESLITAAKAAQEAESATASATTDKPESSTTSYTMTPEARALAANFAANKKRLPWPVERGLVVSQFGRHRHPVAKNVMVRNNGIDIATEQGSTARAAFQGEVSEIIPIPGESLAILLKHGNYFTLYKNVGVPFVKKGDPVKSGQELGLIFTDKIENKTVLHFEVWNNLEVLDPMLWLASK